MAYSEYWNPKNETMPREQLNQLQLAKLRRLCAFAYENVPFHRRKFDEAGFRPDQLETLDDIRRIPFMTREEWSALNIPRGQGVFFTCGWFACQLGGPDGEGYGLSAMRNPRGPVAVIDFESRCIDILCKDR